MGPIGPDAAGLGRLLNRLAVALPGDLQLLVAPAEDNSAQLFAAEAALIERAVASRRNDFSTGRWLARRALAELDVPPGPIAVGPMREPIWPDGIVGSLTHSGGCCAALVGRRSGYIGLGVDVEASPVKPGLIDSIVTSSDAPHLRDPRWAALAFSAKESVYKCMAALCGTVFDFHDIALEHSPGASSFTAKSLNDSLPLDEIEFGAGFCVAGPDGVATAFLLRASAPLSGLPAAAR